LNAIQLSQINSLRYKLGRHRKFRLGKNKEIAHTAAISLCLDLGKLITLLEFPVPQFLQKRGGRSRRRRLFLAQLKYRD
jgi:hypothetical protein